jgi:hypothetical protein
MSTVVVGTIRSNSTSPPTIQDTSGTEIGTFCRAWVNFDGTTNVGGFCTIRSSFNVTTVADNGTGDYTVNFTNALPDANYNFALSCQGSGSGNNLVAIEQNIATNPTTLAIRVLVKQVATSLDRAYVCAAIFR